MRLGHLWILTSSGNYERGKIQTEQKWFQVDRRWMREGQKEEWKPAPSELMGEATPGGKTKKSVFILPNEKKGKKAGP